VISALFGLFQGGIVPAYAIIVREHFTAGGGTRIAAVITATLFGWRSALDDRAIFDLTARTPWRSRTASVEHREPRDRAVARAAVGRGWFPRAPARSRARLNAD